jgi:hypothetical protein
VSHGNWEVVGTLLDAGQLLLNEANKAGYTPVMLAALATITDGIQVPPFLSIYAPINVRLFEWF